MTVTPDLRSTRARSAGPWALLLACLLVAAQWLLVTHGHEHHADDPAPGEHHAPHACELCVAFASVAPAPAAAAGLAVPRARAYLPQPAAAHAVTAPRLSAHRSRAPPALHSA